MGVPDCAPAAATGTAASHFRLDTSQAWFQRCLAERSCRIRNGRPAGQGSREIRNCDYSEVVGSIMVPTRDTLFAGKPPRLACSRTASSVGAM